MSRESSHYSYREYARREIAEGFDELRFGGPIGGYLREYQEEQLERWIPETDGRTILDIGAGTGRTAIPLARAGARVIAADASEEMLRVAKKRAEQLDVDIEFSVSDVMDLPFASRQFQTILIFRVLMHVTDWKKAVAEICRCASEEIIFDFPPRRALAALLVPWRWLKSKWDSSVQRFRVFSLSELRREFQKHGFRFEEVERLWFLPIAVHKKIGKRGFTTGIETFFARLGLRRLFGAPITVRAKRNQEQDANTNRT